MTSTPSIDLHSIWSDTLTNLQLAIPRASFDTWMRDTQLLRVAGDEAVIGTRNAYAQDWLDSRMNDSVKQLLSSQLGHPVRVRFVVSGEEASSVDQDVILEEQIAMLPDPGSGNSEKDFRIAPEDYDSIYEQVVRPDRAVYMPGYFRRWLRHLGPDLAWMYVAFRQMAYVVGARQGHGAGRFTGKQIAALSGISERTFWNRAESPATWEKLAGLVKFADHGAMWDEKSSTPKRLARRYSVAMTLALTPVDTMSLLRWIKENIERCGGPEGVLRAAASTPLEELLPNHATETTDAATVRKLVRQIFDGGDLDGNLLDSLAAGLQNHIMPPHDQIKITLYFLETILPHLGAGPAWMLTLLRDLCYTNPDTGEVRDLVTVPGGYQEIAGWMGMSRAKSIWEWLNSEAKGKEILKLFLQEIASGSKQLNFAAQPRFYKVLLNEIPQALLEAAVVRPPDDQMAQFSEDNGATFSIVVARFSEDIGATFRIVVAQLSEVSGATCTVKALNSLKPALNSIKPPPTNTASCATEPIAQGREVAVRTPAAWGLDRLLNVNRVTAKKARALRALKASGQAFVSWILYAIGRDGSGINSPVNYAISRLELDPTGGAGGGYDRLADLPPQQLLEIAHNFARGISALAWQGSADDAYRLWFDLMGNQGDTAIRVLRVLMGEDAEIAKETQTQTQYWDGDMLVIETNIARV